jgi:signal transduction histidine kinase
VAVASVDLGVVFSTRWRLAWVWAAGVALYCLILLAIDEDTARWVNNAAWLTASACGSVSCLQASRLVEPERRRSWQLLCAACAFWFFGQVHWTYAELALGRESPVASLGQLLFCMFPVLTIAGLLAMPETRQRRSFTPAQAGNLGLIVCCLALTLVLGMLDPALRVRAPSTHLWFGLAYTLLVATTPLAALYALWSYHWAKSWTALIFILSGTTAYAISDLVLFHLLLTGSYSHSQLINAGWLILFGCIACAAYEQVRASREVGAQRPAWIELRERWLEAIVPGLLILVMIGVALVSADWLTSRSLYLAAALFGLYAVILAAREIWLQREAHRLKIELVNANEQMCSANAELTRSETRYRELNTELEERVHARTVELKRAYDELESFSYAAAHDLKGPLRAINGFSQLLELEAQSGLSERGRELLTRINDGSLRMAALIDDLLAYATIERSEAPRRCMELPALIADVLLPYREELERRRVALRMDVPSVSLLINEKGFVLALRNLIDNALKYTRHTQQPRVDIKASLSDRNVMLVVADNGVGFDMTYHDQIFTIFKRLHREDEYSGTGIGLALVRKAIERMDGRVWAESSPGAGATFYVELPREVVA